jgi:ubiquinone/menaquinone biosynthesis C-methylase UbiE
MAARWRSLELDCQNGNAGELIESNDRGSTACCISSGFPAAVIKNPTWSVDDVTGQYSYADPHADIYRFLRQWSAVDYYLNVGLSRPGQKHLHTDAHLRLIDRMAEMLLTSRAAGPYAHDDHLLDIASGRGGPAIYAYQKYGFEVVGIDICHYNVRCAQRNAAKKRVSAAVNFVLGNALALPFGNASFPVAWSIESPAHFPDKRAFLRELARVLKPGGTFVISDLLCVEDVATLPSQAGTAKSWSTFFRFGTCHILRPGTVTSKLSQKQVLNYSKLM